MKRIVFSCVAFCAGQPTYSSPAGFGPLLLRRTGLPRIDRPLRFISAVISPGGSAAAEATGEVQEGQGAGRVAARIRLCEVAGYGVHLLTEIGVAHDGGAPLLHHVLHLGLLAVELHPAWRAERRQRLARSAPTVARDRT